MTYSKRSVSLVLNLNAERLYLVVSISHFHGLQGEGAQSVDQVMKGHIIQVPRWYKNTYSVSHVEILHCRNSWWQMLKIQIFHWNKFSSKEPKFI